MDPSGEILLFGLVQFFMLIGLFGLLVPVFPGLIVMWLSVLGYGIGTGFEPLGIVLFVLITLLTLLGMVVDNLLMGAGARKGGASWLTIGVGMVAGVVGTLVFPPLGGLIAAPLAILLMEFRRAGDWNKAWMAVRGLATGWGIAFVAQFGIGVVIMILWWIWVWQT